MEQASSLLAMQMTNLAKEVKTLLAQYEQKPAVVYPHCGWNGHMMGFGPQREQWLEFEEEIPPMYPYQDYNHQASYEQEWQDHQWSNHDKFSTTEQRILDIEGGIERDGFHLKEYVERSQEQDKEKSPTNLVQEVEEEKEEPPRLPQSTYPFCSHEEVSEPVQTPSNLEDNTCEIFINFEDELKKEREEKRVDVTEVIKENMELTSKYKDLIRMVDSLERERYSEIQKSQALSKLMEEQKEEFARKLHEMQLEVEKRDKALVNMQEKLNMRDNALEISTVKENAMIVEIDYVNNTLQTLTKMGTVQEEEPRKPCTTHGDAIHPMATQKEGKGRKSDNKGTLPTHSSKCCFGSIRYHKRAECLKYNEFCKIRNVTPRRIVGEARQVWVQKDQLVQEKKIPFVIGTSTPSDMVWVVKSSNSVVPLETPSVP